MKSIQNAICFISLAKKEGYADFDGKEIIPVIYESIKWQDDTDIAKVELSIDLLYERLYGYINAKGEYSSILSIIALLHIPKTNS